MGLKKFGKRLGKKIKKVAGLEKPKVSSAGEYRAEAAQQLVRGPLKRQAGAGQISYTGDKYV